MPTDKAHMRKYSSLLRQAINPPAHQCKIQVKSMTGTQTVDGMLGYVFKKQDQVGFIGAWDGYTAEEIEEGRRTYSMMNASALKARKSISVAGWAKVVWGWYEKNLFPWTDAELTLPVSILVMIKTNHAYIADSWCRIGNTLNEEKSYIATKSIFQPLDITLPDVRYVIFNESTKMEIDDEDDRCPMEGQEDFVNLRKRRYEYLTPKQLPCGNKPTTTVWCSPNDIDYTADELLKLAKDQRLAREADRRRPETPDSPHEEDTQPE